MCLPGQPPAAARAIRAAARARAARAVVCC